MSIEPFVHNTIKRSMATTFAQVKSWFQQTFGAIQPPKPSLLHIAIQNGQYEYVRRHLRDSVETAKSVLHDKNLLVLACHHHHWKIADLLVGHGVPVDGSTDHLTPLMMATEHDQENLVIQLLRRGSNPNTRDVCGTTPLMVASMHGFVGIGARLLRHGAKVNLCDKSSMTALMHACKFQHVGMVRQLLNYHAKVNLQSLSGTCKDGNLEIADLLLTYGANINGVDRTGVTPLMIACIHGHAHMVEYLLQKGANDQLKTKGGWSAWDFASIKSMDSCMESLQKFRVAPLYFIPIKDESPTV